jgi:signal transduction histidine kinase
MSLSALVVAIVAAVGSQPSLLDLALLAVPVAAVVLWERVPAVVATVASAAAIVAVQHTGTHEEIMFEASILAFVVARWTESRLIAAGLGLLLAALPAVVSATETRGHIGVGTWLIGIVFPWGIGRALFHQAKLAAELEASRRELADRAMLDERRRIARDVHDFVGHGLAAAMLQVTSARHVLRRDPAAAEDALRSAEQVGRRSMQELRRTVALLRSDDEPGVLPPVATAKEIPRLVEEARGGGLDVDLRLKGDLAMIAPGVGTALYRIAQEALANAARHASRARTVLALEIADRDVSLVAETTGPTEPANGGRAGYGLVGMRERATALGGEFAAGPTPDGWRVSCRIPLARAT